MIGCEEMLFNSEGDTDDYGYSVALLSPTSQITSLLELYPTTLAVLRKMRVVFVYIAITRHRSFD